MMTEGVHSVFVGSVSVKVTNADLHSLFKQFGTIKRIYIAPPGLDAAYTYGFVCFEREDQAQKSIEKLHGIFFHGRRLRVEPGGRPKEKYQPEFIRPLIKNDADNVVSHSHTHINQQEANDRGKYLTQLKNIYGEVFRYPVSPGGARLPELSQIITEINQLPLRPGPVYDQKKPQYYLDLDVLDNLSEQYYKELGQHKMSMQ